MASVLWTQVAPQLLSETYIRCLCVYNDKLYGGTGVNGKLYEWNETNAWVEVAPQLNSQTYIYSLCVYNGALYGGTYPDGKLFKWNDVDAWGEVAPQLNSQTTINSLCVHNGKLYGGTSSGGRLFEWNDVDAWAEVAPISGSELVIKSLTVYNSELYGGTSGTGKLLKWNDVDAWSSAATYTSSQTSINSIIVYNGKLYGGTASKGKLFYFDDIATNDWVEVADQLDSQTNIDSLCVYNNKLYGGTGIGGRLFEWNDTDAWVEVAPQLNSQSRIYALAVFDSKLYGGTGVGGRLFEWESDPTLGRFTRNFIPLVNLDGYDAYDKFPFTRNTIMEITLGVAPPVSVTFPVTDIAITAKIPTIEIGDVNIIFPVTNIAITAKTPIIQLEAEITVLLTDIPITAKTASVEIHAPTAFTINDVGLTINNKYLHLDPAATLTYDENISVPEDFTHIYFIKLPALFTGEFMDYDDDFKIGYDGDKFYYEMGATPTYGISRVLPDGFFKIGVRSDVVLIYTRDYTETIVVTETAQTYESVRFSGEVYLDNNHLINKTLSDAEIGVVWDEQIRTIDSEFLGDYEDSLDAGSLTAGELQVDSWRVRRRKLTDTLFTDLATVSYQSTPTSVSFFDYLPRIGVDYEYEVYSVLNGIVGSGFGGEKKVSTFGWILENDYVSPATPTTTYIFDLEIDSSDISTNRSFKKFDNYTKYCAFRFGDREYRESQLSTMPYTFTSGSGITIGLDMVDDLRDFINNGEPKWLRNYFGDIYRVITYDFSYKFIDKIESQPLNIKFSWSEISPTG